MPHFVNIKTENQARSLKFTKADSHNVPTMKVIKGGTFPIGESYGTIEIDHFCFYSIVTSVKVETIPENLYQIIAVKEAQPNIASNLWNIHICVIPLLPTCLKVCCT